jgi:putative tricarboxylic transport membrane protein
MSERSPALHQTLIGAATVAVAAVMAIGAWSIPSRSGYAGVGPNFLPWVVSATLALCGLWLLVDARRGGWRDVEQPSGAGRGDWAALAWVVAGIAANALLLTTLGFVFACTLCFVLAVRGLRASEGRAHAGARGLALDFATGVLIAAPAFWLFTKVLGITLPSLTDGGWI